MFLLSLSSLLFLLSLFWIMFKRELLMLTEKELMESVLHDGWANTNLLWNSGLFQQDQRKAQQNLKEKNAPRPDEFSTHYCWRHVTGHVWAVIPITRCCLQDWSTSMLTMDGKNCVVFFWGGDGFTDKIQHWLLRQSASWRCLTK